MCRRLGWKPSNANNSPPQFYSGLGFGVGGTDGILFRENISLSGVARRLQCTGDLANWSDVTPLSLLPVQTAGAVTTYEAVFPSPTSSQFFRLCYDVTQ